jgi:hypothetical protein
MSEDTLHHVIRGNLKFARQPHRHLPLLVSQVGVRTAQRAGPAASEHGHHLTYRARRYPNAPHHKSQSNSALVYGL